MLEPQQDGAGRKVANQLTEATLHHQFVRGASGAELSLHSIIRALVTRRHIEHQRSRSEEWPTTCSDLRRAEGPRVTQTTGHRPV